MLGQYISPGGIMLQEVCRDCLFADVFIVNPYGDARIQ